MDAAHPPADPGQRRGARSDARRHLPLARLQLGRPPPDAGDAEGAAPGGPAARHQVARPGRRPAHRRGRPLRVRRPERQGRRHQLPQLPEPVLRRDHGRDRPRPRGVVGRPVAPRDPREHAGVLRSVALHRRVRLLRPVRRHEVVVEAPRRAERAPRALPAPQGGSARADPPDRRLHRRGAGQAADGSDPGALLLRVHARARRADGAVRRRPHGGPEEVLPQGAGPRLPIRARSRADPALRSDGPGEAESACARWLETGA